MTKRKSSILDKPTRGWEADLPLPSALPSGQLLPLSLGPNHLDNIYMEIPGSHLTKRGILLWLGIIPFIIVLIITIHFINLFHAVTPSEILGRPILFGAFGLVIFSGILSGVGTIRNDISPPRDQPIRFNRLRRRVYVYRFHQGGLFVKKGWGVRPVVFNWDDLRAEAWSRMGPTTSAVPIFAWGVDIAVVEPGTNHVIDRFQLAGSNANGEHMWAMARAFMNQGPDALPKYLHPPRDWNNDVPWYNLALRLAPKVQWPADMDRESRTAP